MYEIISHLFNRKEKHHERDPLVSFFLGKITGFILFGIVPYLTFICVAGVVPSEIGLTMTNSFRYWYLLILSFFIVLPLTFWISKNHPNLAKYRQLRIKYWSLKYILISNLAWILYLLGYEFFLRGILWFTCYKAFGFWPALLINISVYSIVHLSQGIQMTLGAIPVGIIFCLFSFLTGSFLFAFLIHCCMAITNDLFSIYNNPEFRFNLKIKNL
jgi:membrane protease YdiL (CAAX protease family)